MNDQAFIADRVRALTESISFFSNKNKPEREHWIADRFLKAFQIDFQPSELQTPNSDPPDILFRAASFEIKEILDPNRPRHKEFKDALKRAQVATCAADLLEDFTPVRTSPLHISERLHPDLEKHSNHYAPGVKMNLDLLLYVNFQECFFEMGSMPDPGLFERYGWRSISAFENSIGMVFYAAISAPAFLRSRVATHSNP